MYWVDKLFILLNQKFTLSECVDNVYRCSAASVPLERVNIASSNLLSTRGFSPACDFLPVTIQKLQIEGGIAYFSSGCCEQKVHVHARFLKRPGHVEVLHPDSHV